MAKAKGKASGIATALITYALGYQQNLSVVSSNVGQLDELRAGYASLVTKTNLLK
jgi:hypothetical protein